MTAEQKTKPDRPPFYKRRAFRVFLGVFAGLLCLLLLSLWFFTSCPLGVFAPRNPYAAENATPLPTLQQDGVEYQYNQDIYNLLLLGVDRGNGDTEDQLAGQADVLILISLNKKTRELSLLQIPRDTFVPVRVYNMLGEYLLSNQAPICTAYAYGDGGISSGQMMETAVSELLYGIPVERFISVDIQAISWMANAVGGVPVTGYAEFAEVWNLPEDGSPILLTGEMAEIYVRGRNLPGMDGSDQNRLARQKEFLFSLLGLVRENTKANPLYPVKLYTSARESVQLYTDMSFHDLCFFTSGVEMENLQTHSVEGEAIACNTGQAEQEFVPNETALRRYVQDKFFVPKK